MGKKNILIYILIFVFLVSVSVVGYYFYKTYFSKLDTPKNNIEETSFVAPLIVGIKNGGGRNFPQTVGGVDDFNNEGLIPFDSFSKVWMACSADNEYCYTNDANAEKKDPVTGLVWSKAFDQKTNWFIANNCKSPNGISGDDGICDTNGEVACLCIKHIRNNNDAKIGCEGLGSGSWRLPFQKEMMQAYIDGSYENLSNEETSFWSSTTSSTNSESAWVVNLSTGSIGRYAKTLTEYSVRCVQ